MVVSLFSSFFVVTTAGQSMPASDRDPEGRRLVGHGVVAALHVPRRGARRSGTARRVPKDGADASGSRVGRCEQRRCQNSSSLVLRREQWQCAGKYEFQLSRLQATDLNLDIVRGNWTLDFRTWQATPRNPWQDNGRGELNESGLSPPPEKRPRSYSPPLGNHVEPKTDLQESLLGQALAEGPTIHTTPTNNVQVRLLKKFKTIVDHRRKNILFAERLGIRLGRGMIFIGCRRNLPARTRIPCRTTRRRCRITTASWTRWRPNQATSWMILWNITVIRFRRSWEYQVIWSKLPRFLYFFFFFFSLDKRIVTLSHRLDRN